jgi:cytochrome c oxidase subunit 4
VPYRVYVIVWLALVVLTGVTVGAYYADMGHVAILTAIIIASVKVTLVLLYFMHLRYAHPLLLGMVLFVLFNYVVFLSLTFTDYIAR